MSIRNVNRQIDKNIDAENKWLTALSDVTKEIQRAENRLSALRQSAQIITQKLKTGEPFPTTRERDEAQFDT